MVGLSRKRQPGAERTYTVSMSAALYSDVQRIAEAEGRSMNKQIQQALIQMVESRKRSTTTAKAAAAA